ncbi:hypothetical protein HDU96_002107 [Phlyctochytrium bullatum]|nr:hypothetical protein HDU96_002107 [Phlyctochytrium bullatum]
MHNNNNNNGHVTAAGYSYSYSHQSYNHQSQHDDEYGSSVFSPSSVETAASSRSYLRHHQPPQNHHHHQSQNHQQSNNRMPPVPDFYFDPNEAEDYASVADKDLEERHPYPHQPQAPRRHAEKHKSVGAFSEFSDSSDFSVKPSKHAQDMVDDYDNDNDLPNVNEELYDVVDTVVPKTDNPDTPALTFRVWTIGMTFSAILAVVNTIFTFRTNFFALNPFVAILASYPIGNFMAWALPRTRYTVPFTRGRLSFTLNPGPFNFKEHVLIYIFTTASGRPIYALYNVVVQRYFIRQDIHIVWCILFGVLTQLLGFSLAGLTRRVLVRPAAMLWPSNLGIIALLRSLASNKDSPDEAKGPSRTRFFWLATIGMALYQWFPSFVSPALGAISLLCHMAPNSQRLKMFGSARHGLGMLSFSFDWSVIAFTSPIVTPFWALLNQFIGVWLMLWVVVPLLWTNNAFGADQQLGTSAFDGPNGTGRFPLGQALNSPAMFDKDGNSLSPLSILNITRTSVTLNEAAYNRVAPIRFTTYFAIQYMSYFIGFTAVLCHAWLWYGKNIWYRLKANLRDLDAEDIHAKLMDAYPDIPDSWYYIMLVSMAFLALAAGQWGGFDLPWWAVFLSLAIAGLFMIPVGVIAAISGQQIGLNVVSEMIIGYLLPGRMVTTMSFKTLTYVASVEGLFLVQDMKLAHYAKVPHRAIFAVQMASAILTAVLNVLVVVGVYEIIGVDKMNTNPPLGWSPVRYQLFLAAGTLWGGIGPARVFGPGSPYWKCLFGFALGAVLPVLFYTLHKLHPSGWWHLINVPIVAGLPFQAGTMRADLITPFVIAVLVNVVWRKIGHEAWLKYAYILSAAFDTGAAISLCLIFAMSAVVPGYTVMMPFWYLNRGDQESCVPEFYQKCTEKIMWKSSFGNTYNYSTETDPVCQTFGMEAMLGPR